MAKFKELLKLNTTVGKLAERALLAQSSEFFWGAFRIRLSKEMTGEKGGRGG
jgi:hypothetical protein